MNRHDQHFLGGKEAVLQYLDGDFRIVHHGTFVRCAVTGQPIPLEDLRYWSVDLQEAYASPQIVHDRLAQLGKIPATGKSAD